MRQLEYSCYNTVSNWLSVHFVYTTIASIMLSLLVLILYPFKFYASGWPYGYHERFNQGSTDDRIRRFLIFILLELASMFTYISVALALTWTLNISPITPMAFNRWIIEACYAPMIPEILLYFYMHYTFFEDNDIATVSFHVQFAFMIKLFLFMFMRYRELYPTSDLNNLETRIFHKMCNASTQNYTRDFKPLRFLFYHF
jgi:hypothetical protein